MPPRPVPSEVTFMFSFALLLKNKGVGDKQRRKADINITDLLLMGLGF